jgi:hypothetical protein
MRKYRTLGGWPLIAAGYYLCFCLCLAFGAETPELSAQEPAAKQSAPKDAATPKSESPQKEVKDGIKLKVQLIWGTDLEKPLDSKDKKIKELDPKFKEKLGRCFKWKHYYQVDRQSIVVPLNGSQITCMSHDCMVEIFHRGENSFELNLYGENKLVLKTRKDIHKGEYLFAGGDVKQKENEAWIVSVSTAD